VLLWKWTAILRRKLEMSQRDRSAARLALRALRRRALRVDEARDVGRLHGLREVVVESRFAGAVAVFLLAPSGHGDDEDVRAARFADAPCGVVSRELG